MGEFAAEFPHVRRIIRNICFAAQEGQFRSRVIRANYLPSFRKTVARHRKVETHMEFPSAARRRALRRNSRWFGGSSEFRFLRGIRVECPTGQALWIYLRGFKSPYSDLGGSETPRPSPFSKNERVSRGFLNFRIFRGKRAGGSAGWALWIPLRRFRKIVAKSREIGNVQRVPIFGERARFRRNCRRVDEFFEISVLPEKEGRSPDRVGPVDFLRDVRKS